jgi:SAM-dependent methyltransferase
MEASLLVPGCGLGHDVLALAKAGHRVTGIDVAPTAVARARERCAGRANVAILEADFLALPEILRERFDAVVEHTCFCALPPARLEDYVLSAHAALVPGGRVVGAFLDFAGGGPPWGTNPAELHHLFGPLFEVEWLERATEVFAPAGVPQLEVVLRRRAEAG